jgi:hypothetical protein
VILQKAASGLKPSCKNFFGTPRECRPDPGREGKKPKREPFEVDDGCTHLPMLALPVKVPRQRNIMPTRRVDVLPADLVVAMPDWPFARALHGILLRLMSNADNLEEDRERHAATGVIKS